MKYGPGIDGEDYADSMEVEVEKCEFCDKYDCECE